MEMNAAQQDMREAYYNGAPGILVSSIVWLATAAVHYWLPNINAVAFFFVGGMMIHPIGMLVLKLMGRSGKHQKDNPLIFLAAETTVGLITGIVIAVMLSRVNLLWFFPMALTVIGLRYLMFQTLYGLKFYWVLGGALLLAAFGTLLLQLNFTLGAFIGGSIEFCGALLCFGMKRKMPSGGA